MVVGAGRIGARVSRTVTGNERVATRPSLSVAVHVTVVVPIGNMLPETSEQTGTSGPSCRSFAIAAYVTAAPAGPVASAKTEVRTVSVGIIAARGTMSANGESELAVTQMRFLLMSRREG